MERCSTRVLRIGSIPVIVCNEPYGWTEIESDLPEMLVEPQPDFRKFKRRLYKHLRFVRSIAGSLTRVTDMDEEMFSHLCAEHLINTYHSKAPCLFKEAISNVKTSCLGDSK